MPPFTAQAGQQPLVAVIGAGVTGLVAAWLLQRRYRVTLFEANSYAGGHANTVDLVLDDGRSLAVDTGFIVYNQRTYPGLTNLFERLAVPTQASDMSFAVSLNKQGVAGGLEYSSSPAALLGQWRNWRQPHYAGMLYQLLRLYRSAAADAVDPRFAEMTLGEYVAARGFGQPLLQDHLMPMAAAIWSMTPASTVDFPLTSFMNFCRNHGLLQIRDRPRWRTVTGGSRCYVQKLLADCQHLDLRLNQPVQRVIRLGDSGVEVATAQGVTRFDQVVFAVHGAQILPLLGNPSERERAVLSAFQTTSNRAVLHHDTRLMPRRRVAWSAWNVLMGDGATQGDVGADQPVCVTYWMNRLQNLPTQQPVLVTLNPIQDPDPATVRGIWHYQHPLMDRAAIAAQAQLPSLEGIDRLWFGGAWSRYGFHEDGLQSAVRIAEAMGVGGVL